jgi:hypothetical protein
MCGLRLPSRRSDTALRLPLDRPPGATLMGSVAIVAGLDAE